MPLIQGSQIQDRLLLNLRQSGVQRHPWDEWAHQTVGMSEQELIDRNAEMLIGLHGASYESLSLR